MSNRQDRPLAKKLLHALGLLALALFLLYVAVQFVLIFHRSYPAFFQLPVYLTLFPLKSKGDFCKIHKLLRSFFQVLWSDTWKVLRLPILWLRWSSSASTSSRGISRSAISTIRW